MSAYHLEIAALDSNEQLGVKSKCIRRALPLDHGKRAIMSNRGLLNFRPGPGWKQESDMKSLGIAAIAAAVLGVASVASAAVSTFSSWDFEAGTNGTAIASVAGTGTNPFALTPNPVNTLLTYSNVPANPGNLAANFSGATTATSLGNAASGFAPTGSTNYGIEFWVKGPTAANGSTSLEQTLFDIETNDIGIIYKLTAAGATPTVRFYGRNSTGTAFPTPTPFLDGSAFVDAGNNPVWTSVAVVHTNSANTVYVNGNVFYTNDNSVTANFVNPTLTGGNIGLGLSWGGGTKKFLGQLDNVRLFTFEDGQFNAANDLILVPEPTMIGLAGLSVLGLLRRHRA